MYQILQNGSSSKLHVTNIIYIQFLFCDYNIYLHTNIHTYIFTNDVSILLNVPMLHTR